MSEVRSDYEVWVLDPWTDEHFEPKYIGALTHGDAAQKYVNSIPFNPSESVIPNVEIIVIGDHIEFGTGINEGRCLKKFAIKPSGLTVVDMSGETP